MQIWRNFSHGALILANFKVKSNIEIFKIFLACFSLVGVEHTLRFGKHIERAFEWSSFEFGEEGFVKKFEEFTCLVSGEDVAKDKVQENFALVELA